MPKIILTIGVSGSGKTKWTEELVKSNPSYVNINRDDIRFSLFTEGERDWSKYKFNKSNEKRVTEVQEQLATDAGRYGNNNIIISDTNLNPSVREKWKKWADKYGYEYEEKLFPCPWETLVKRNAQRLGGLTESLLWNQYVRYENQFGDIIKYEETDYLPECVICDIDGTIASMEGRSPFDWSKVGDDLPRQSVIDVIKSLKSYMNLPIIFLSGREEVCREATSEWITNYLGVEKPTLYMRKAEDNRKDSVIKDELFEEHIRGNYNVHSVFDDRRQMIRHWTLKGMPNIFDVGNYNEEF